MRLDAEQQKIVRLIKREGRTIRNRKLRRIFNRAAVETGLVESNLRNLHYGDADSLGWRQERASLYKNPTNLRASIRRFKNEFLQHYDPGETAGEVAAQVQRPAAQYRGRYQERLGEAKEILRQVGAGAAGGQTGESSPFQMLGGGGRPGRYTIPGVDNSQLRQQAMLQYLDVRGKPGALLELKAALDSAQDVPSRQVKVPSSSLNNGPANSRNRGGRGNSSSQDVLRRTAGPTAKPGKIIGVPYSGTHTLGNWQSDNAVDIAVPMGTRITAATGGRIVKIHGGWHGGSDRFDGYQVTIEGPDGGLFYTHLRSVNVKVGQRVKRGQVIGRSGAANGVEHLHFGVQRGDPRRFVR